MRRESEAPRSLVEYAEVASLFVADCSWMWLRTSLVRPTGNPILAWLPPLMQANLKLFFVARNRPQPRKKMILHLIELQLQ